MRKCCDISLCTECDKHPVSQPFSYVDVFLDRCTSSPGHCLRSLTTFSSCLMNRTEGFLCIYFGTNSFGRPRSKAPCTRAYALPMKNKFFNWLQPCCRERMIREEGGILLSGSTRFETQRTRVYADVPLMFRLREIIARSLSR